MSMLNVNVFTVEGIEVQYGTVLIGSIQYFRSGKKGKIPTRTSLDDS
jgi:hypothetical protein